ncbi:uncharacterized protein [Haliotis cracherodii]|uniref:uncharacterized protein n=1 Tax=Haliotis cracherodii TaxID=6455 RepID=UPI0039E8DDDD
MDNIIQQHPFILITIIVGIISSIVGCIYYWPIFHPYDGGLYIIKSGPWHPPPVGVHDTLSNTLDLHEMKAKDAKSKLEWFLEQKEQERKGCNGSMTLTIITGRGNHSLDGRAVLNPVVKKYLENNGYKHNVDPKNTGRLFVQLP